MRDFLSEMLYALTSAYTRKDYDNRQRGSPLETNIGKLFSILAWGLDTVQEQTELIRLWDNIDNARGSVLDRYGANFGVQRYGADDSYYRLTIKVKVMSQLSGGDTDTVIRAAAELMELELSDIEIEDIFPAKLYIYIDQTLMPPKKLALVERVVWALKRIIAAGVSIDVVMYCLIKNGLTISHKIDAWTYFVPECNTIRCGTWWMPSTLGWSEKHRLRYAARPEPVIVLPEFTGTLPDISTRGYSLRGPLHLFAKAAGFADRLEFTGTVRCGTAWTTSMLGWSEHQMLVVDNEQNVYAVLPEFTGTLPDSSTLGYTDIHNVTGVKNNTRLHMDAPEYAGNARTGTVWTASELGWSERTDGAAVGGKADAALVSPEFTGTLPKPSELGWSERVGALAVDRKSDAMLTSPEFTGTLPRPVAVCGAMRAGTVKKEELHGE